MVAHARPTDRFPRVGRYVAGYGFYVGVLAATFFAVWLWHTAAAVGLARAFAHAAPDAQLARRAFYYAANLALGLAALIFAVASEGYIRTGIERRCLRARIGRVAAGLVVAILFPLAIRTAARGL